MKARQQRLLWGVLACAALLAVWRADACAVCFAADKNTRPAFYATGMLLTGLPFVMVGSFACWFRRRLKRAGPGRENHEASAP